MRVSIFELKQSIKLMVEREKYLALYNSEIDKGLLQLNIIEGYKEQTRLLNERVELVSGSWLNDAVLVAGSIIFGFLIGSAL